MTRGPESFKSLVGGARLKGAVAEAAAPQDAARRGRIIEAEEVLIPMLVTDPFPGVAAHVFATVRADAAGKAPDGAQAGGIGGTGGEVAFQPKFELRL